MQKYEIKELQTLVVRDMLDCRMNVLSTLLRFYNISVNPYALLLCSGQYGFYYKKSKLEGINGLNLYLGGTSSFDIEKDVFDSFKIPYKRINFSSENVIEYISSIKRQVPILYGFDSRYILDEHYQDTNNRLLNLFSLSLTLVCGIDVDHNEIQIVFKNEKESTGLKKIPLDRFLKSRTANTYPIKPSMVTYELMINKNDTQKYHDQLFSIQTIGLKNIIKNMLYGSEEEDHVFGGIKTIGISGLSKFKMDLTNDLANCKNENDKLFVVKFAILKEMCVHGSYTCYREEFGEALRIYNEQFIHKDFSSVKVYLSKASILWRGMVRQFFSAKRYMNKKEEFYTIILDYIDKIIDIEQIYFNELEKLILI